MAEAIHDAAFRPLADRMRPLDLGDFVGQGHILGVGKPLRKLIESGRPHSLILWGPPGSGKTTLARLLAGFANSEFHRLSAVVAGVRDIRSAAERARALRAEQGRGTLLFLDEVHRFNKAQQDVLLPHVEDGTLVFAGATTENPSFEVNNALLSRARVYVLKRLTVTDLEQILDRALRDRERGIGAQDLRVSADALRILAEAADGDARRALNLLQMASETIDGEEIDEAIAQEIVAGGHRLFDKGGDQFYDQISALHKSVRGSSPDAAVYWLARMIDGGCDPLYIARRVVRMASEDIGNADPRALRLALDAWDVQQRLGSPEGELAIAQAVIYLACAPKSNAVYLAWGAGRAEAARRGSLPVPLHLRNAPTGLMKDQGFGDGYRYAHDEPEGYAAGERYFPPELAESRYYRPVNRGLEIRIKERLERLRELDRRASGKSDPAERSR